MTRGGRCFDELLFRASSTAERISELPSSLGPVQRKVSANWCCLKLFPGALMDLSCRGGRPGIVANLLSVIIPKTNKVRSQHTRIHGNFLNCRHRPNLWYADLAPSSEVMLVDSDPQTSSCRLPIGFVTSLGHGQSKGFLRVQGLAAVEHRQLSFPREELVLSLGVWLLHSPREGLVRLGRRRSSLKTIRMSQCSRKRRWVGMGCFIPNQ